MPRHAADARRLSSRDSRTEIDPDANGRSTASTHIGIIGVVCLLVLGYSLSASGPSEIPVTPSVEAPTAEAPVLISPEHPLQPIDYVPSELTPVEGITLAPEAARDYIAMTKAASADGVVIAAVSGYRPYSDQAQLFDHYATLHGANEASRISAPAGHSEHQSGLAVDVGNPDGACALQPCFAETPAGAWVAENAWRYGFIVRYPAGAEAVTGYVYEPWHLRWIGTPAAAEMREDGAATLEEFLER